MIGWLWFIAFGIIIIWIIWTYVRGHKCPVCGKPTKTIRGEELITQTGNDYKTTRTDFMECTKCGYRDEIRSSSDTDSNSFGH